MELTKKVVKQIQDLLEPETTVLVELAKDGIARVSRRPIKEEDIFIVPTQACADEKTELELILHKMGEPPIPLFSVPIPEGYYITGIKVAIPREEPTGE